jgi:hypothetical protein
MCRSDGVAGERRPHVAADDVEDADAPHNHAVGLAADQKAPRVPAFPTPDKFVEPLPLAMASDKAAKFRPADFHQGRVFVEIRECGRAQKCFSPVQYDLSGLAFGHAELSPET